MFACIHGTRPDLSEIAEAFTPFFEQTAPGTIVFRIDSLRRLYGTHHQIAQAIAQQVEAEHRGTDRETRAERCPRRVSQLLEIAAVRDHRAPTRRRRLHAQSQKG